MKVENGEKSIPSASLGISSYLDEYKMDINARRSLISIVFPPNVEQTMTGIIHNANKA